MGDDDVTGLMNDLPRAQCLELLLPAGAAHQSKSRVSERVPPVKST